MRPEKKPPWRRRGGLDVVLVGEHSLPQAGEHLELLWGEALDEVAAYARHVRRPRLGEPALALVGEDRERPARVSRAARAAQQALALEPVDEPREPAARQVDGVREVAHAHLLRGRVVDRDQDLVVAEREAVRRLEL